MGNTTGGKKMGSVVSWLPQALVIAAALVVVGFIVFILSLRVTERYFSAALAASTLYAGEHPGETAVTYEGETHPLDAQTADRLYGYLTQPAYLRPGVAGEGERSVTVSFGGGSSLYARGGGAKLVYVEFTAQNGREFKATLQYPVVNAGWKGLMNCLGLPTE